MPGWMGLALALATAQAGEGQEAKKQTATEHARRLLDEALLAELELERKGLEPTDEIVARFRGAANAMPQYLAAQFDFAVALERAGKLAEAEQAWRAAADAQAGEKALRVVAAERAMYLALSRKDAPAARQAAQVAAALVKEPGSALSIKAEVELQLGAVEEAAKLARQALMHGPKNARALVVLARAQLALGQPGTAKILARRAASDAPQEAQPHLVLAEVARAASEGPAELAEARAAAEAQPGSLEAQMALGKLLFDRGDAAGAQVPFTKAVELDGDQAAPHLGLGAALAEQGQTAKAEDELGVAAELSPAAAGPHLLLARLKLDREHDAGAALEEAKLFLKLSQPAPPASHQVHLLMQRCERMLAGKSHGKPVAVAPGQQGGTP